MRPLQETDPPAVGPYRLLCRLGVGGMGMVYLGVSGDEKLRVAAIKVIRPELAHEPPFPARFRREVSAARLAGGGYTGRVIGADPDGSPPWLATEYIPGPSLTQVVSTHGPLPPHTVRALAAGIAQALHDLHRVRLVHRDLKPGNVLLAEDGPRIIDFGVARLSEASVLTSAGQVVGTPGFVSPEQIQDDNSVGPASDVFALGGLICFATTGAGPFGAASSAAVMLFRIVHQSPQLRGVPQPLRGLTARCLARDPAARPTAEQILAELVPPSATVAAMFGQDWLPPAVSADIRDRSDALRELLAHAGAGKRWPPEVLPGAGGRAAAGLPRPAGAAPTGADEPTRVATGQPTGGGESPPRSPGGPGPPR